jgi:hypothetical protein
MIARIDLLRPKGIVLMLMLITCADWAWCSGKLCETLAGYDESCATILNNDHHGGSSVPSGLFRYCRRGLITRRWRFWSLRQTARSPQAELCVCTRSWGTSSHQNGDRCIHGSYHVFHLLVNHLEAHRDIVTRRAATCSLVHGFTTACLPTRTRLQP